jgi:hypothetical protein
MQSAGEKETGHRKDAGKERLTIDFGFRIQRPDKFEIDNSESAQ